MDLDATQAIDLDWEVEEEGRVVASDKIQVGSLTVQAGKGLEENTYPVYEGQNILGRHEKADIFIPAKALSKRHACIEVVSGQHFIFDYGSKNRTRRGKMCLRPNVRYELTDECRLMFADVICDYRVIEESKDSDVTDSLSEADSGSMLLIEESMLGEEDAAATLPLGNEEVKPKTLGSHGLETPSKNRKNETYTEKNQSKEVGLIGNDDADFGEYVADSDTDNDDLQVTRFETPENPSSITFVKQTPGTLLKQHLDESLDGTCPASKTIEDSMQDEAIMSLKLDITKDSEKSPVKLSDTQDDIESSDIEADLSRTRPGRVWGLLIHESDDDTDDSDRSVESNTHNDPNDLNDYKWRRLNC